MSNNKDPELDKFVSIVNIKLRIKDTAKQLGFTPTNDVLFSKHHDDKIIYMKFDSDCVSMWSNKDPRKKYDKLYITIRESIDNGYYDEKGFIENAIDLLK